MRKVIWSEYVDSGERKAHGQIVWKLTEIGEALFHQFGSAYEEFESGAGNYSTAIIELPDGTVKMVRAEHIRFIGDL